MDEIEYHITCDLCGTNTVVLVEDEDETPAYCPMCGNEAIDIETIEIE